MLARGFGELGLQPGLIGRRCVRARPVIRKNDVLSWVHVQQLRPVVVAQVGLVLGCIDLHSFRDEVGGGPALRTWLRPLIAARFDQTRTSSIHEVQRASKCAFRNPKI